MIDLVGHTRVQPVIQALKDWSLSGEKILVALSGGPDSVALFHILAQAAPVLGFELGAAHVNHGYRGQAADGDQAFSRDLARDLGIPFFTQSCDVAAQAKAAGISLEEAGRQARYAFFSTLVADQGFTRIATGHHRDDNVEQVLMNLLRGSGLDGLAGIPALQTGLCEAPVIRPLLSLSKGDLLDLLSEINQDFCRDATNADTAHRRNALRHHLIPLLEERYNPRIREGLDRLSQMATQESDFLDREAEKIFNAQTCSPEGSDVILKLQGLTDCHPALLPRVLRLGLRRVKSDLKRISHTHIRDMVTLMAEAQPGKHLDLPGRIRVYRERERVVIRQESRPLREIGREEKQRKAARNAAGKARKS